MPLATPAGRTSPPAGLARAGLPEDLLGQLRRTVTAGTSALFLLASQAALDTIGADDSIRGSDALVTTLGDEHEQILRHVFGADDAYPDWTE